MKENDIELVMMLVFCAVVAVSVFCSYTPIV
jgi:hypothetical protein